MVTKYFKVVVALALFAITLPQLVYGWSIFPSLGEERAGTASMQFLKLGAGARAAAMGNAVVAVTTDAYALYWNPAGIVWSEGQQVALSHNMWVADLNYEFAGFTTKLGEDRAIGVSAVYLGTTDMDVTDEYHPYGTGQKFGYADVAFAVTLSQRLTDYFSFGASAKYAQENIDDLKMHGVLLDLGTYYQTNYRGTRFAVTLTNFGQQVKPGGSYNYTTPEGQTIPKSYQSFSPPTTFRISAAINVMESSANLWQATVQLDHPTDNAESFSLGTEYGFNKILFLRGGYKVNNDTQSYSVGLGAKMKLLSTDGGFDYAFASVGDLGHSNTFSFYWSF